MPEEKPQGELFDAARNETAPPEPARETPAAPPAPAPAAPAPPINLDAVRRETAEATLRELDVQEREGKLLALDAVEERWLQITTTVREAVLAIAGTAVQDGLLAPGKEAALDDIVRAALTSIPEAKR